MQPIVVAVDFSVPSIHAIEYSIPIASKFGSDIILVWVDKITPSESIYPDTTNENRNEAKKRFEELISHYRRDLPDGIKMEYKLRKGKIYTEIEILAKSVGASLIVTGTHGLSGFEEFWIGSNAFKVVTYASCPVITVRHDFEIKNTVKKILVPIDSSVETVQKIPFVAQLAEVFKSEIHVVTTHYCDLKSVQRIADKYAQQAVQYLGNHKIRHVLDSLVSTDITKSVISYASTIDADLVAIMTEQETPANILLGPHAQQLVNQCPIPILSMHPQEHFCL
jgi:nucleotide-binding universal stress UspA family protein